MKSTMIPTRRKPTNQQTAYVRPYYHFNMRSFMLPSILGAISSLALSCAARPDSVIETDIAIIGGGGTGAYAAGGHTNVWTDPVSNEHFSYGVEVFVNSTIAPCRFLTRLDIPVQPASFVPATPRFADFRDGKPVDYTRAPREEWLPALQRLETQWAKYDSMFLPNTDNFPAPGDIPDDLFMMWPDFARKCFDTWDFLARFGGFFPSDSLLLSLLSSSSSSHASGGRSL
ncbi:hypothetical protein F5883DRAFT_593877 [Diaporthe sp. PMI_573]|nr:hypothetical protein F5883DRAFT_593877 [Diaporthaceae sp. PMI_573]